MYGIEPARVWIVYRNQDMTEGRGHMIMDSIWLDMDEAIKYMDSKCGVFGRQEKWSETPHGDWQIEETPVFYSVKDKEDWDALEKREAVLRKLSEEDRKILGL